MTHADLVKAHRPAPRQRSPGWNGHLIRDSEATALWLIDELGWTEAMAVARDTSKVCGHHLGKWRASLTLRKSVELLKRVAFELTGKRETPV